MRLVSPPGFRRSRLAACAVLATVTANSDVGVDAKDVEQVLIGIAPVVGTARLASATTDSLADAGCADVTRLG